LAEERGDLVEAERAFVWVTRLDAASPYSWLALARFLEDRGRYGDAEDAYREAQARVDGLPEIDLGLARVLVRTGRDDAARPRLEAAARAGIPEAFAIWGRLELRGANEEAARAILEQWTSDAEAGAHRERRIELALAVGDFRRAVDDLVVQADDREVRDGERLVDAARHGCREGTALMWFRSRGAAKWGPEWARVALTLARETSDVLLEGAALEALGGSGSAWAEWLLGRGRYEEALEASEGDALLRARALRGLSRDREALEVLAAVDDDGERGIRAAEEAVDLLLELGRFEDAVGAAEAAAENPSDPKSTAWLRARVLAALGRSTEAEDAIGRGWTGTQRHRRIARLRAESAAGADTVREALWRAVEGGSRAARRELARLEEREGGDALSQWNALTDEAPEDIEGWLGIARLDPTRRAEALERARETGTCDARPWLEAARDVSACEALPWLQQAWEAAPSDPEVLAARSAARADCERQEVGP